MVPAFMTPALARWHTMPAHRSIDKYEGGDPADEFDSPYLYVGNNPIIFVDPDGAQANSAHTASLSYREITNYNLWGKNIEGRTWENLGKKWYSAVDRVERGAEKIIETHIYNKSGMEIAVMQNGEFFNKHGLKGLVYEQKFASIPEDLLKTINGVNIKHMRTFGLIKKGENIKDFFNIIKNKWSSAKQSIEKFNVLKGLNKLNNFLMLLEFVPTIIFENNPYMKFEGEQREI